MPALPTVVSDYIDQVKESLKPTVANPNTNFVGPGINYLRAMDLANVLQLLAEATDPGAAITATGGSTTTATVTAAVDNSQNGNTVTFTGNVTAALAGVEAVVIDTDSNTLTFDRVLPGAVQTGDTFTVSVDFMDSIISAISGGASVGNVAGGEVYSFWRDFLNAVTTLNHHVTGTAAVPTFGQTGPALTSSVLTTMTDQREVQLDLLGAVIEQDQFKGMTCVVGANSAVIVKNSESGLVTLKGDLGALATAGAAVTIEKLSSNADWNNIPNPHAGGQPAWNAMLAQMLDEVEAAVVSYTVLG